MKVVHTKANPHRALEVSIYGEGAHPVPEGVGEGGYPQMGLYK